MIVYDGISFIIVWKCIIMVRNSYGFSYIVVRIYLGFEKRFKDFFGLLVNL